VNPNADTVDGYHAAGTPQANTLIALDGAAYLRVPRVIDSNNASFYVDPTATSVVNELRATRLLDRNNISFLVDPAGTSVINDLHATRLLDRNNPNYVVDPASISTMSRLDVRNMIYNGGTTYVDINDDLRANRFVDRVNTSYYVDPASTSTVNRVQGNAFRVNGSYPYVGYYVQDSTQNDINYGLYVSSADSYGVYALSTGTGGYFRDTGSNVFTIAADGPYGIRSSGIIRGSNITSVQPHPTDSEKTILYGVLEGGEAGTYYRGTARLKEGTAVVELPEHFSLGTEEEGLTVQVTPRENCSGLYVAEVSTKHIVVKELQDGTSNARFDFFINGVRAGYRDFQVFGDASELEPNEAGTPIQEGAND
jgi:hypothetical protein